MTKLDRTQIDRIVALREKGRGLASIAAEFGVSVSAVSYRCLMEGANPPKPPRLGDRGPREVRRGGHVVRRFTPEEDATILEMERRGEGPMAIARALGRKSHSIAGRLATLARREELAR